MSAHDYEMVTPMDNNIKLPAPHFFKIIKDEENAGNKIVSDRTKRNGSKVIIFKDGGKLVFKKSGFLTREFSDGKKIIYSPIGKRQVVRDHKLHGDKKTVAKAASSSAKIQPPNPTELIAQQIEHAKNNGNAVVSDRTSSRGIRKITFQDRSKLHLHNNGTLVHKYANGKKVQLNPDGKTITIDTDGTLTENMPNGARIVTKPDGRQTVTNPDGTSGTYLVDKRGKRQAVAAAPSPIVSTQSLKPLFAGIRRNDNDFCRLLVEGKASVNQVDHSGQSPLHIASANGNVEITALLLEHQSAANLRDKWGETPLHVVSQVALSRIQGQDESVVVTTAEAGSASNQHLHLQAAKVATQLLRGYVTDENPDERVNFSNPNVPDNQGRTALHAAALRGAYAVCGALVEHGKVDLAAVDHHGETALHLAIRGGSVDCVLALLVVVDFLGASAASESAGHNGSALINCKNKLKETALHMACMMELSKASAAICALLFRGADVRCREKYGRTALHLWCDRADISVDESESAKVVQLLMKQFPGLITARTYTGAMPLHLAISRGNVAVVKELMKNGANVCSVASIEKLDMELVSEGVGVSSCFTPITALRAGLFPGALPEKLILNLRQKEEAALAGDNEDSVTISLGPPSSSSYSSPRNPARWSSMVGLPTPVMMSMPTRRNLMQVLLNTIHLKIEEANWLPDYAVRALGMSWV